MEFYAAMKKNKKKLLPENHSFEETVHFVPKSPIQLS
jgi:hypothetical protein